MKEDGLDQLNFESKESIVNRSPGVTTIYNEIKEKGLQELRNRDSAFSEQGRVQGVTTIYNEMKDEGIRKLKNKNSELSSDNRPSGVTTLYNAMKEDGLNKLRNPDEKSNRFSKGTSRANPNEQKDEEFSYDQSHQSQSFVPRDSIDNKITPEMYKVGGNKQVGTRHSNPSEINLSGKKNNVDRMSLITEANRNLQSNARVSDFKKKSTNLPKDSSLEKQSSVKVAQKLSSFVPKLSQLSENGRPTNYSVFYKQFIENAVNDFNPEVGNRKETEKKNTIESLADNFTAKVSEAEENSRNSKLSQQIKSSTFKKPSEQKKNTGVVSPKISNVNEIRAIDLPQQIKVVLESERNNTSNEELNKLETEIKKQYDPKMIDEFYRFCREQLPDDNRYKESILFVSLFYYFLETKDLLN